MRLSGLLGLAGLSKGGGEPSNKRQKRTDVLDSLGLGGPAKRVASLSAPGLKGSSSPASSASASKSAASAVSGLSGSDADKEALRQWLAGEDPEKATKDEAKMEEPQVAPDAGAEAAAATEAEAPPAVTSESSSVARCPVKLCANWRDSFAQATDRWAVEKDSLRGFYFHSEQGLFFEWDQRAGLLFQYFFNSGRGSEVRTVPAGDELPERSPIWSSDCPETHAEVWEVLPLPPTDPAAKASEEAAEPSASSGASVDADRQVEQEAASKDSSDDAGAPAATAKNTVESLIAAATSTVEALMAPPPLPVKRKKRPPVPAMAPPPASLDDDDDDPRLPGESDMEAPVMGCAGPPPAASSSSAATSKAAVEEEEDDGSRPLMFDDSDDEVGNLADLADDCALPAAPAEKAEPSAADLDLDMFAGL